MFTKVIMVFVVLFTMFVNSPTQTHAEYCAVQGNVLVTKSEVWVRDAATQDGQKLVKLRTNETVSSLGQVEGQSIRVGGQTTNVWSKVRTQACSEGFVFSALMKTADGSVIPSAAPAQQSGEDLPVAEGIFSGLGKIDKAVVSPHLVNGYSVKLSHLGMYGWGLHFNGYNSSTPFGDFTYPANGEWYSVIQFLRDGKWTEAWAWRQNGRDDVLLVFVFNDMGQNADENGNHMGSHNFLWWGGVLTEVWDRATRR